MNGSENAPLWALTACELGSGYTAGAFSPLGVLDSVMARFDAVNPLINAVVTVDRDGAHAAAAASTARHRAGKPLSRLDGVPITVKDNIAVKGMRATWGSRLYADHVPAADELAVARLRMAGAVILGKTNCPEFTLQGYTDNTLFGATRNPYDLALTPGGSSGGAVAAVAAGIGPIAIATDGGGSIRRPASHTGLIGLKPSRGRVPRDGGFPPILFDLETVGPIARAVDDVALIMGLIASPDARDPASRGFVPFAAEPRLARRILYVPRFGDAPVDEEIAAHVDAAANCFADLGHSVEQQTAPFDVSAIAAAWPVISQGGLSWLGTRLTGFGEKASVAIRDMAAAGRAFSAADYVDALLVIRDLERRLAAVFERYDLILTPSAAALPWPATDPFPTTIAGRSVGGRGHAVFTAFVNMAGLAGINLPCGSSRNGLPIGLQLVAPVGGDGLLVSMADECEAAALWSPVRPQCIPGLRAAVAM
ncbi:amidase [Bradyrhizobium prioriisuperbiae]|uniref:amidase n=1 Tax=Bradyrhizobium prioriisuperbiae TaxID=2854389 RepID=UPI0028E4D149|nr:amidase [Bradyrhizobium prioritasuperba]